MYGRILISFLLICLLPIACSKLDPAAPATITAATTSTTTSTVVSSDCTSPSATLAIVGSTTAITVGQQVLWKVSASGCSQYVVDLSDGTSQKAVNGLVFFSTQYGAAELGHIEGVTVHVFDSTGKEASPLKPQSAPFDIVAASGVQPGETLPFSCTALAVPNVINMRVTPGGAPLDPQNPIYFSIVSTRPSHLTGIGSSYGPAPFSAVNANADSIVHQVIGNPFGPGVHIVQFQVTELAGQKTSTVCAIPIFVRPIVIAPFVIVVTRVSDPPPPPVAPTCTLVASSSSAQPGQSITLRLSSSGKASSGTVEGQSFTVNSNSVIDGSVTVTAGGTKTYSAIVTGPGGNGSCSATVTVNSVKVGINFEDWTDADYNDAVECFEGAFGIQGTEVVSYGVQDVPITTTKLSGCDHQEEITVLDQNGAIRSQSFYNSSQLAHFTLHFEAGWKLRVRFRSLSSFCKQSANWNDMSSPRVRVGNYCLTTGD